MQLVKIKLGGIKEICQLSRNCAQIAEVKLRGRVGRLMSARFMPPSRLMQNRHGKRCNLDSMQKFCSCAKQTWKKGLLW